MAVATRVMNSVVVLYVDQLGWLTVSCANFDVYKTLPSVVECEGKIYGLKGWNSDRGHAYYQPNPMVAKGV